MKNLNGIILCGGHSKRMGADKGLLKLGEHSFIEHLAQSMSPFCDKIFLCGSKPAYTELGLDVIADIVPDSGALGGLYSGLIHTSTNWNLVLSCDAPLVDAAIIETLIEALDPQQKVVHAITEKDAHPLIGCYHKDCAESFKKAIDSGHLKLQPAVQNCKPKQVEFHPPQAKKLLNINTPEDYQALLKLYS